MLKKCEDLYVIKSSCFASNQVFLTKEELEILYNEIKKELKIEACPNCSLKEMQMRHLIGTLQDITNSIQFYRKHCNAEGVITL